MKYKYSREQIVTFLDDLENRLSRDEGKQSLVHCIKFNILEKSDKKKVKVPKRIIPSRDAYFDEQIFPLYNKINEIIDYLLLK
jgi:hypothetical protein